LRDSSKRNRERSVPTVGDIREMVFWEFNISIVEKHTNYGSYGNTFVLALYDTTKLEMSVESGEFVDWVFGFLEPSKKIKKSIKTS